MILLSSLARDMPRPLDDCGTMRVVRLTGPTRECCCMPLPPWLVQWLRGGLRLSGNTTVVVKSLGQWCLASTSGTTSVGETHFNIHMSAYANPLSDHGTVVHYSCPPATSHNNAIRRHGRTRGRERNRLLPLHSFTFHEPLLKMVL